jgi:phosphatidylglycerol---prolipoprotein diacylglyceryl transferase
MIPYFEQPRLVLGPLTIHAFGVLVAVAVLVGHRVFRWKLKREGMDTVLGERLLTWVLVAGFICAHLFDRLVYYPGETLRDPVSLLKIWASLSSFGGFLGAVIGAWLFIRSQRGTTPQGAWGAGGSAAGAPSRGDRDPVRVPEFFDTWRYLDAVAFAFPFGWIFGRLGCFVAFDHPGLPTNFFLGMEDRNGVVIHNLGLEEAIFTVGLSAVFALLARRPRFPGFYLGLLPLLYAPYRFASDFLRVRDVRYLGLTPAQWGTLALLVLAAAILARGRRRATPPPPGPPPGSAAPAPVA